MTNQPVFSGGTWWVQDPDGSWLQWDQHSGQWRQAGNFAEAPLYSLHPPAYAPPQHPYVYSDPRPSTTNAWAIASLVLGIVWIWWIGAVLGVLFGLIALREIKASGGNEGGKGLAIAGIATGGVWIGLGLIGLAASFIDL